MTEKIIKGNKIRESNFELLRIISMLLIVAHHFSACGNFNFDLGVFSLNRLWIDMFEIGGKLGVNIFVFISGYFLISSKGFRIQRLLKIWGQLIFYSVSLCLISYFLGYINIDSTMDFIYLILKTLFPVSSQIWWFASTYFILYIFHPFINIFLKNLNKGKYIILIFIMTVLWCIIPTFTHLSLESNNLLWFFYLYSIAAYIKIHGFNIRKSNKFWLLVAIISIIITYLCVIVMTLLGLKFPFFADKTVFLYYSQSVALLIIAFAFFMLFKQLKIKSSRIINTIASTTFGVYLIHQYPFLLKFIWIDIFHLPDFQESMYLIPYSFFVVIVIFAACSLIDLIRIYTVEKIYIKIINKIIERIQKSQIIQRIKVQ